MLRKYIYISQTDLGCFDKNTLQMCIKGSAKGKESINNWTIEVLILIIEPTQVHDAYQYTALGKLINFEK